MSDEIEQAIIERVLELYEFLAVGEGECRNCGRKVYWVKRGACGRRHQGALPFHEDGLPHFPDRCPKNDGHKEFLNKKEQDEPLPEPKDEVVTDIPF